MSEQSRAPLPHDFHPEVASFTVTSEDVAHGADLHAAQVLTGKNVSPQLRWEASPRAPRASP